MTDTQIPDSPDPDLSPWLITSQDWAYFVPETIETLREDEEDDGS